MFPTSCEEKGMGRIFTIIKMSVNSLFKMKVLNIVTSLTPQMETLS